jgi:hypothetical protein
MGKVRGIACGQVVDAEDRRALAEQAVCEMRTKEPGGAGYKCGLRAVPQLTCPFRRIARWLFLDEKAT